MGNIGFRSDVYFTVYTSGITTVTIFETQNCVLVSTRYIKNIPANKMLLIDTILVIDTV